MRGAMGWGTQEWTSSGEHRSPPGSSERKNIMYAWDRPELEGKLYRPSNGTEGEMFMEQFCYKCVHDKAYQDGTGDSCEIICNTMVYSIDDPNYPKEWVFDSKGQPKCTKFEIIK